MIFYESPYRLVKALDQMTEVFGENRPACVAREISKMFEEFKRGSLKELSAFFTQKGVKGEIVILVTGKDYNNDKFLTIEEETEEEE